jgi:hypothetical protein
MQDCICLLRQRHAGEPLQMRDILAELLAQYQSRFPDAPITVIETPEVQDVDPDGVDPVVVDRWAAPSQIRRNEGLRSCR